MYVIIVLTGQSGASGESDTGDLREAALKVTGRGLGRVTARRGGPPDDWALEVGLDDAVATRTKLGVPLPLPEAPIKNTQANDVI